MLLSAIVFLLTTISLAYHHHSLPFRGSTCSICKVKSSLSSSTKTRLDQPFRTSSKGPLPETALYEKAGYASPGRGTAPDQAEIYPGPNKAPPTIAA